MRSARFAELDALIAEQGRRRGAGRPPGRSGTRYGFAALDRGDAERLKARMALAPLRENGMEQRALHARASATRRAKAG